MNNYKVLKISYDQTKPFILDIHYAKRMPSITYSFGLYLENELVGVVTYGSPASQSLCKGIAGDEYKKIVLELNRLVLKNNIKNEASYLVGNSFKLCVYADDTAIFCRGKSCSLVQKELQLALNKILAWIDDNRLTLNVKKTKCMLIGTHSKVKNKKLNACKQQQTRTG